MNRQGGGMHGLRAGAHLSRRWEQKKIEFHGHRGICRSYGTHTKLLGTVLVLTKVLGGLVWGTY